MILTAAILLVIAATVAVEEPTLTRFEVEAPAGNVEVRPWQPTPTVWSEHPFGRYVRPSASLPTWGWNPDDPFYPPGFFPVRKP